MANLKYVKAVAALVLALSSQARAAEIPEIQEVTAEGSATIENGDEESAKKAAILDAERAAVDQVGSEIISETVVENFDLVRDKIVSKAHGFIHGFKLIDSGKKGSDYHVKILAKVSTLKMSEDATMLYDQMGKPRVMVLVPQVKGVDEMKSRKAETEILAYFHEKRFAVVDAETARANIQADEKRLIAEGDAQAAAKAALRANAEVVILGDASVGEPQSIMDQLFASMASVSLRAVQAGNAKILAVQTVSEKAVQGSGDMAREIALTKASKSAAKALFTGLVKCWNDSSCGQQASINLVVTGVTSFSRLKQIQAGLSSIKGVSEVSQRTFDSPTALLEVKFNGSTERFAEVVDGKPLNGVTLSITTVEQGKVSAKAK